jgi:hypothetical protein
VLALASAAIAGLWVRDAALRRAPAGGE